MQVLVVIEIFLLTEFTISYHPKESELYLPTSDKILHKTLDISVRKNIVFSCLISNKYIFNIIFPLLDVYIGRMFS